MEIKPYQYVSWLLTLEEEYIRDTKERTQDPLKGLLHEILLPIFLYLLIGLT